MTTSKRLAALLKMTSGSKFDPFAWYAMAMEYKGLGMLDESLATFETLREKDPAYVPMYLICGGMFVELGKLEDARTWFGEGLLRAKAAGDTHALGELEGALAGIE